MDSQARLKDARILFKDWYRMVNFIVSILLVHFHVEFSSVCCFIAMYVSISLLRNVEGGDPSSHTSKKQKKCGSCHSFLTDLDPHSECNKRGNQLRGGTILGRYAQRFHLPPKLILPVARFFPHGNWRTPLLANGPSQGLWACRPCHSLVGPPGATI